MRKIFFSILFIFCVTLSSAQTWQPADPNASPEARSLFTRLLNIQSRGIMYGHQDDLMTGHMHWFEPGRSDTKETVGDYPAVAGFELGEVELGGELSLDSVAFINIADRVRWFNKQGGVITVSWHCINPITSRWPGIKEPNGAGSAWDVEMLSADSLDAVRSVLPGGCNHAMFNQWLTRLGKFFLTWRDEKGTLIPFVFRPLHEHSGNFFWWGTNRCSAEEYSALWRYIVDFLRNMGLHNILYAYNTDKIYSSEEYLTGYPGDDYIDLVTIDWYGQGEEFNKNVDKALTFVTQIAMQKHKLYALSECAPISVDLQKILAKYKPSYVLTWRHAPARGGRIFVPPTAEQLAKMPADVRAAYENWLKQPKHEDLLKIMKSDKHYLFLKDIQNVK